VSLLNFQQRGSFDKVSRSAHGCLSNFCPSVPLFVSGHVMKLNIGGESVIF